MSRSWIAVGRRIAHVAAIAVLGQIAQAQDPPFLTVRTAQVPEATDHVAECGDPRWYVSGDELSRWRAASDLVIVDTRPSEEFRRVRIPGSISVPAYALPTKMYLKQRHVLLVGRGGRGVELEAICRMLSEHGFESIAILEGGLISWAQIGGGLVGDQRSLNRITPADFSREAGCGHWLVVDVSPKDVSRISNEVSPATLRIPFQPGRRFRASLQRALRERSRHQPSMLVLLTDQNGASYEGVEAEINALDIPHLYFLDGGLESYRAYRVQQDTIVRSAARGCTLQKCGSH